MYSPAIVVFNRALLLECIVSCALVYHLEFHPSTANLNTSGITLESPEIPVGGVQHRKRILKAKILRIYNKVSDIHHPGCP